MNRLQDKIVIVTGGATGIGLGISRRCVAEGAAVVMAQRRIAIAEAEASELRKQGHRATAVSCDVSKREDVQSLIAATVREFGRVDVMVNNAALTGEAAACRSFLEETDEHWRRIIDVNLNGAFIGTQEAARQMILQGEGGSIVNISSVAQFAAQEHAAPYCASKAGLDGLTKAAAIELGQSGIRVNNVAPGDIDTQASADVQGKAEARGATGKFFRFTPQDRRGTPEEIGHVVVFLASDEASFVTGATWLVDGGFLSY
ncbi:MAG: SDR family oxidoreductase [Candidatus Latescibacteria bacterium]|nr:SDR family oxidoreductase [Candidatus Latescibacterota bacterium]